MPPAPTHPSPARILLLVVVTFFLAACSTNPLARTPAPTATIAASPTPSPTLPPSPTPQPDTAILLASAEADTAIVEALQKDLADLTASAGMALQIKETLTSAGLTPAVKVVVALAPDPGLAGLAASAPSIQFVGIGLPGLQNGSNLSAIGGSDAPAVQAAFLAGFVAAIATPDWRVAVLSQAGNPQGEAVRDAFLNGGRYLCGLCNPKYPPYAGYPLAVEVEGGGDWQPALDVLAQKAVETVYVDPGISTPDLLAALAKTGMQIVGSSAPSEVLRPRWIATVNADPAATLTKLWPQLLAGKAASASLPMLAVSEANSAALTPGRMRLVEQVIQDLTTGMILPSNPAQ